MTDYSSILEKVASLKQKIIELRREFHKHPEVALEEFHTANTLKGILEGLGIETRLLVDGAGVRGHLTGSPSGKTIALRADTDALPMQENSDAPYRSEIPGCMHACGHDAHMAMLLGAAMILSGMKEELPGNVVFIFQPAEETGEGAKRMVEEGVLADVDTIFGLHVASVLPAGVVGYRAGPFMAAGDFFNARIIGKGGHGGMPHLAVDPIPMAAQFINGLQTIVSRETDPLENAVVSVCSLEAGMGAYNVLPDAVDLRGTIRYLNPESGSNLSQRVRTILEGVTSSMRGSFEFNLMNRFPSTINDEQMTAFVAGIAGNLLGKSQTLEMKPLLGSEDFSYYLGEVPGTLVFMGVENKEKGIIYPHHHPKFDVDEDALPIGAALHAAVALGYLGDWRSYRKE
jgi:amidohydrolase